MSILGQPIDRIDGRRKVTGTARYAAEFAVPGVVYAVMVESTIGAGQITGFDLAEAGGMPGVIRIITPANAIRLAMPSDSTPGAHPPPLQDMTVLYNGQPVALVVADTLDRAIAGAAKVRVRYKPGEPVTRMESVLDQAYVPKHFRNGTRPPDSLRGDPEAAFATAAVRVEATYVTPIEHHNPMEPHATIGRWDSTAGRQLLTVWHTTQGVSGTQATLAALFSLNPADVRVICPFVGGGFGCKGSTWSPAVLAAMAAKVVGRPVKLVISRAQMFTCNGYRPQTVQKLRFAAGADGRLISMRHDGFSQMSMPVLGEFTETVGLSTEMLYACDNVAVTHRLVATNASLPTSMRAPGESSGNFALESAMDELAAALGIDPIEFRLRNYADSDQHLRKPFASKELRACYAMGAEAFGWSRRTPAPRSMRDGHLLVGLGMATGTYPTNRSPASARVRLAASGTALVQVGSQDLGTGTYTVMAQTAAATLGVPVGWVQVQLGDTTLPQAPTSGGSQTVASVGPAVLAAAQSVRAKLFEMARADRWPGVPDAALTLRNGALIGPDGRLPIAELMARRGIDAVEATERTAPARADKQYSMHAFNAQFAEVRVDPELGEIRVVRYVGAFDCGHVLNAKTARSQLIGGITYGLGMALLEQTHVDEETGRVVNSNISEYLMPVNADVPAIEAIIVPSDDHRSNPLGAKGIGELPMVGVAAAVANAVWHATGVRVRRLPIRIEDVISA